MAAGCSRLPTAAPASRPKCSSICSSRSSRRSREATASGLASRSRRVSSKHSARKFPPSIAMKAARASISSLRQRRELSMGDEIRVLVVEDDENVRFGVQQAVELAGLPVSAYAGAADALAEVAPGAPLVIVSDVRMPGIDGLQLLDKVMAIDPQIPVVLISGHADISTAVGAMQVGAYDFIEKPFSSDHIARRVARAVEKRRLTLEVQGLRAALDNWQGIEALVLGKSPAIAEVRKKILRLADTSVSVLITGETGTGKELIAR